MKEITLYNLDHAMSIATLNQVEKDKYFPSLSEYFSWVTNSIWKQKETEHELSIQRALEEKYTFILIAILNSSSEAESTLTSLAANELKNILDVLIDGIFLEENDHNTYLLEIIDSIEHPALNKIILL
ncbi:hypothetical protein [Saccharicrinis aurantiacus]|uniref:hypothetical protein n=1 Tax=Saccharicrinis aurantiacus TaxID=1849719 RepID=UPI00083982DD|nr:hypothetical protein [Saccharicrinis aurantiacus]